MVIQKRGTENRTQPNSMIKELCARCQMSRPACVTDDDHKIGAGGKINIQSVFFLGQKICREVQESFMHFMDIYVLREQVLFMIKLKTRLKFSELHLEVVRQLIQRCTVLQKPQTGGKSLS
jgi:hypothetical protein